MAGVVIAKDPEVVTELAWWANNIGVTGGAFDSYLLLRGLRTLVPRMELAQRNAQAIVKYLQTQPLVKKLYHPSLPENQGHEIAARQQKGFGAMLSFELDGDEETLRRFWAAVAVYAGGIFRGSGKFDLSRRHHDACRYVAAGACRRRDLRNATAYLHRY